MAKNTVLVTGASSGIGKAIAQYFAQQGWSVAATMRSPEKEQELNKLANVKLYALDVTKTETIKAALGAVKKDFGGINVVINNAGYGADGVFEAMNDDVIERQFDTNVFGLMRVTREAIPYMREQKDGVIIQIASMGGRLAFPLYSIYHGTKWAVEGFSEALMYELAPLGIKMKIVEPGAIKTDFYGRSREFVMRDDLTSYKEFVKKVEKVSMEAGDKGESPMVVAKTVFKAATDGSKKLRYPVGNPAPMLLWLRKLVPDSWWFGVVRSSYKI